MYLNSSKFCAVSVSRFFKILGAILILSACQRGGNTPAVSPYHVDNMEDLIAPEGFAYEMLGESTFSVALQGPKFFGKALVQIYGVTSTRRDLVHESYMVVGDTSVIHFKSGTIYQSYEGRAQFGDGSSGAGLWSHADHFGMIKSQDVSFPTTFTSVNKSTSVGCESCDTVIQSGKTFSVSTNDTLCLGDGLSGYSVNVSSNGTLKLCGSHTGVGNIAVGTHAKIIITENSNVSFANGKGFDFDSDVELIIQSGATLNCSGAVLINNSGSLHNYGSLYVDGHLNIEEQGLVINYGTTAINGHIEVEGANTTLTNHGLMYNVTNNHIRVGDTAKIYNYCHLHSDQHIWIDTYAELVNFNQIDCDHKLKIWDEGFLTLGPTSIAVSEDLELKGGLVKSVGVSTAVLKISDDATYFGNARVQGDIDLCVGDKNQNLQNLTLSGNARFSCQSAVPRSMCITIGHDPELDSDGDDVANNIDPYPNDSTRCGIIGQSSNTLVFEDNWPYKGDYDFNDLVLNYCIWGITNSQGKLKDIMFRYKVRAKGASYKNGFGIELATDPTNVSSPDLEEQNTASTSAIILNKIDDVLQAWNTDSSNIDAFVDVPWDTVIFTFTNPVESSVLNTFNPFIFVDGDRTREVHLVGHTPTSLADEAWFGTGDDYSSSTAGYYRSYQNQPWALNIPIVFDYPVEGEDITGVYYFFSDWATSGGTTYEDWYDSGKTNHAKSRKLYK